jgi:hypothetical protein
VRITKGGFDHIEKIELFQIENETSKPIAYGWYGQRRELLGSILRGEYSSGIRVRAGNILIGDAHLLGRCFKESRFNSYVIGEIHVDSDDLIPNSRRDDFVDNKIKGTFYNEIERLVGLPISKQIRLRSRLKSEAVRKNKSESSSGDSNEKSVWPSKKNTSVFEQIQKGDDNIYGSQVEGDLETNIEITDERRRAQRSLPHYTYPISFAEVLTKCCKGCDKLQELLNYITKA